MAPAAQGQGKKPPTLIPGASKKANKKAAAAAAKEEKEKQQEKEKEREQEKDQEKQQADSAAGAHDEWESTASFDTGDTNDMVEWSTIQNHKPSRKHQHQQTAAAAAAAKAVGKKEPQHGGKGEKTKRKGWIVRELNPRPCHT